MARVVRVAVVGATGYAGVEAVRLLSAHPSAAITYLGSHGQAGADLGDLYPHLRPLGGLPLRSVDAAAIAAAADAALLSLPARASLELVPELLSRGVRVIDFGADFRLRDAHAYARHYGGAHTAAQALREAVYGLPEVHRAELPGARLVANPGCYPTAVILALLPALESGIALPEGLVADGKSGVSGAGRQPTQATHFAEVDGGLSAYRIAGAHRHTPEIEQELSLAAGAPATVSFSPHLVPMARGLLATCYARLRTTASSQEVCALYRRRYDAEPFVHVLGGGALPHTKATAGSNGAQVAVTVDGRTGHLVALAAIDNLGKGAAGQAVQNLNLMFGLPETAGLTAVGMFP